MLFLYCVKVWAVGGTRRDYSARSWSRGQQGWGRLGFHMIVNVTTTRASYRGFIGVWDGCVGALWRFSRVSWVMARLGISRSGHVQWWGSRFRGARRDPYKPIAQSPNSIPELKAQRQPSPQTQSLSPKPQKNNGVQQVNLSCWWFR